MAAPATAPPAPRRLDPVSRREQLLGVALAVTAEGGYAGLTLEEVARRAGVTRAALYRYFPRGKLDLFLGAVERAGDVLTEDLVTDEGLPLAERQARNFSLFVAHALEPSQAWRAYRHGRVSGLDEVDEIHESYRGRLIETMARNHFGTPDPGPIATIALRAYLAFAESALDDCRERGVSRDDTLALVAGTLSATVAEAKGLQTAESKLIS
jgi:AcrR family transcriptional regulator